MHTNINVQFPIFFPNLFLHDPWIHYYKIIHKTKPPLLIVPESSILPIDCPHGCNMKTCSDECYKTNQRHSEEECQLVKKIIDTSPHLWLTVLRKILSLY